MIPSKTTISRRLKERSSTDDETGCVLYLGCWDAGGCGRVWIGGANYRIQRVVAWLRGEIELWEDCYVYRTCKTPACMLSRHVRVAPDFATAQEEMIRRGVYSREGAVHMTDARRRCIRVLVAEGVTIQEIAADLGVKTSTVQRAIKHGGLRRGIRKSAAHS